jgi:DNA polymerase III delta prime subunit
MLSEKDDILWVEKYRPRTIEDCILPDRLKTPFLEYVKDKKIPNLLLAGTAGVGKTTVAKALCAEVGCDNIMINGSDESGIDTFRNKIKGYASSLSFLGGRKVIIIDEADYLNPNSTQPALRNAIEEFSDNCSFIFTCNFKNRIIDPLHSRCAVIDFSLRKSEKTKMASAIFKRVQTILEKENIEYDNAVLAEIIKKHFPDFRRIINELQRYSRFGKIDVGILAQVKNVSLSELVSFLKEKDFTNARKWVSSCDSDPTVVYKEIYDNLYDYVDKNSIPKAVLILADYQYKSAFVVDQEINLMACLTELMIECEFI